MDIAVAFVEFLESLSGGTLVFIRNEDTFKMHGRINSMYLMSFVFRDKINAVDVLVIFSAFDE